MIHHVFVFGVIIPTVITILVFLAFLVCWFKFNMRERFFKKHLTKKKQKKQSVAGQPLESVPTMQAYRQDRGDDHDPDNPPPGGDPNHDLFHPGPPNGFGVHGSRSRSTEFPEDTCSIEDPEAALCSHVVAVDRSKYFTNSPKETPQQSELQMLKCLVHHRQDGGSTTVPKNSQHCHCHVAQTFHFPLPPGKKDHLFEQIDLCDDDLTDDGNYGHFIPLSDVAIEEITTKDLQRKMHGEKAMPESVVWATQHEGAQQCAEVCKGWRDCDRTAAGPQFVENRAQLVPGM